MSGWLTTLAPGLLLAAALAQGNVDWLRRLLPGAGSSGRPVLLGHAAGALAPLLLAWPLAVLLATIPAGLVGYLGFLPLLRGLGQLGDSRFVLPPPPVLAGQPPGAQRRQAARLALGRSGDAALGLLSLLALATAAETTALLALFAAQAIAAPLIAGRLGPRAGAAGSEAWRGLALILVGLTVLLSAGTLNWLLPRALR